ncbi:MAG: hypothetical protein AB8G05_00680 [Oligoflexales bacterium]
MSTRIVKLFLITYGFALSSTTICWGAVCKWSIQNQMVDIIAKQDVGTKEDEIQILNFEPVINLLNDVFLEWLEKNNLKNAKDLGKAYIAFNSILDAIGIEALDAALVVGEKITREFLAGQLFEKELILHSTINSLVSSTIGISVPGKFSLGKENSAYLKSAARSPLN